jgi:hypothetical protein
LVLRVRVLDVIEVAVVANDSPFVDRACHGPNPPGVWTLLLLLTGDLPVFVIMTWRISDGMTD